MCDMHGQPQQPMVMCDMHGQPQQPAFAWPAYAVAAPEPQFALEMQQAAVQPEFGQVAAEQDDQVRPAVSTSARRRMRRQRAADRKADTQASAPASEPPSPPSPSSSASCDATGHAGYAELAKALEEGGEAREAALDQLRGSVVQLTFDQQGCRLVQTAIQVADQTAVAELLAELRFHVQSAIASPHGNYVVQTIITALPTAMSNFVVQELLGVGGQVARHRFGCRVVCRLIEHSVIASAELAQLLGEILAEAEDLCRHSFGHYVMQAVLEHQPEYRGRIAQALCTDARSNACNRCASHVVESVLAHCSNVELRELIWQLLGSGMEGVVALAQNQYGCFVLKALTKVPGRASEEALFHLTHAAAHLGRTKYGSRLLHDLGFGAAPAA